MKYAATANSPNKTIWGESISETPDSYAHPNI
jgi:hypothetical protein